jgi:hypothetical protein
MLSATVLGAHAAQPLSTLSSAAVTSNFKVELIVVLLRQDSGRDARATILAGEHRSYIAALSLFGLDSALV